MAFPHPEWKRLADAMQPLIESGKTEYSYEDLFQLAGIDVRTTKGRQQFFRYRKEANQKLSIWFECVPSKGYRLIRANEHVNSASLRVGRARRMTKRALDIATNTRFEQLSNDEKSKALAAQAAIGTLYLASKETVVKTRKLAGAIEYPKLAAPEAEMAKV